MDDEVEVPQYYICPISLQIMKDPVTTVSGITYDRESIEHWLSTAKDTTSCPVTKQPMPRDSDLTPNHTLRRLIQSWCVLNANKGVDRIPTPKSPMNKSHVVKLVRNLNVPEFHTQALKKMEEIAGESEKSRACMVEAGAVKAMLFWITRRFKEGKFDSVEECLKILHLIWKPTEDGKEMVKENGDLIIDSLLWVLSSEMEEKENSVSAKTHALLVLRTVVEVTSSALLERLKLNFFNVIVAVTRENISSQATKAALRILIQVCPFGRNRLKIVECGAVFELIELELNKPEKSLTELIFCLLAQLCACADGRAQFLKHAGGIAMVAKRILRVSPATDDRAVHVLSSVARFSATNKVVMEMLRVGAVSKLCMVLQADSDKGLKRKAREVLKLHSNVWNNDSPCIAVYLLTMQRP